MTELQRLEQCESQIIELQVDVASLHCALDRLRGVPRPTNAEVARFVEESTGGKLKMDSKWNLVDVEKTSHDH